MTNEQRRILRQFFGATTDAMTAAQCVAGRGREALDGTEGAAVMHDLALAINEFARSNPAMLAVSRLANQA